jgi:predicted nucleic acid-binding protein
VPRVRSVVLDTSVVLPAVLSPRGYRRRFWVLLIPAYTTDRNDDPVIHTALLADATWLIADDKKHISTDPAGITEYQLPDGDRHVSALTFSRFLDHLTDVDLDDIDPSLIETAFRPLGSK